MGKAQVGIAAVKSKIRPTAAFATSAVFLSDSNLEKAKSAKSVSSLEDSTDSKYNVGLRRTMANYQIEFEKLWFWFLGYLRNFLWFHIPTVCPFL